MSKKYKIAFLAPINSIHTIRWANAVSAKGHDVSVFTQHRGRNGTLDTNVKVHFLPITSKLGYFLNVFYLKKIIKKINPDFFHIHYASGYGTLARLSGASPSILSVWGSDIYLFPKKSKFCLNILVKNLKFAKLITSTSFDMEKEILKICPSLKEKLSVVPFGINTEIFKPLNNKKEEHKKNIYVGTVKSLEKVYGIDILIRGFKHLLDDLARDYEDLAKNINLFIVGGGSSYKELNSLVDELGVSNRVKFLGPIDHSEVPQILNKLDIYVAVSRSESFGVAILEASSCGIPVVVSSVGGLKEVVVDDLTGKIIPPEDFISLSKVLKDLILNNDKRIEMGHSGRRRVLELYNWSENVNTMESLYLELIDRYINSRSLL